MKRSLGPFTEKKQYGPTPSAPSKGCSSQGQLWYETLPVWGILHSSVWLQHEGSWLHPESPQTDREMGPQNQGPFSGNPYLLGTPG